MERRSWSACSPPTLAGSGSCAVGPTARRSSRCIVRARSVYLAVAACAVIVYLGALWNEFVWDDQVIVLGNPLVQTWAGLATAFASPYWPPFVGGYLYRPLTLLTYVLDWHIGGAAWFHAVNLLWHAGVSALVAVLARRWAGDAAALVAGMLFAVHPVHVEAVANVVGRAELMAAAFTLLAVYAAVEADRPVWSAVCWALGLLSKEVAVVAPALVVAGWGLLGAGGEGGGGGESLRRPPRRRMGTYAVCWLLAGLVGLPVREVVLHPYARSPDLASAFPRSGPVPIRFTARGAPAALPSRAARRLRAGRAHHGALPARLALRAGVAGARDMGRPAGARLAPSAATRSVRACLDGSGLRAGREFLVSDRRRRRRADAVSALGRPRVGSSGARAQSARSRARARRRRDGSGRGRTHRAAGARVAQQHVPDAEHARRLAAVLRRADDHGDDIPRPGAAREGLRGRHDGLVDLPGRPPALPEGGACGAGVGARRAGRLVAWPLRCLVPGLSRTLCRGSCRGPALGERCGGGRSRSRATPWIGSLGPRRGFTESICCGMPRRASRLPCWRDAGAAIAQRWSPA